MYARVATFEDVDISRAKDVESAIRERALPRIKELSGWSGSITLVDREQRRVVTIGFFQTKEDIEAAEPTYEQIPSLLPDDLRQIVAGTRRSVDVYEVGLQEGIQLYEQTAAAVH
jgi:hypothetical protein